MRFSKGNIHAAKKNCEIKLESITDFAFQEISHQQQKKKGTLIKEEYKEIKQEVDVDLTFYGISSPEKRIKQNQLMKKRKRESSSMLIL
jgi:hypothetical protein